MATNKYAEVNRETGHIRGIMTCHWKSAPKDDDDFEWKLLPKGFQHMGKSWKWVDGKPVEV